MTPRAPGSAKMVVAPFQLGDLFGYTAANGDILYAEKALFRVALSQTGFVNYTRLGTELDTSEHARRARSQLFRLRVSPS